MLTGVYADSKDVSVELLDYDNFAVAQNDAEKYALAAEEFAFDIAVDRDWPGMDDRDTPAAPPFRDHMLRIYKALQERDGLKNERFRLGTDDQFTLRRAPGKYPGFIIRNICANGRILCRDGSIRDVFAREAQSGRSLNENAMSTGYLLTYGAFTFFTAGDWDSGPIEGPDGNKINIDDALAEELTPVNVAKINHHGFRRKTTLSPNLQFFK